MANADYIQSGFGSFAAFVKLDAPVSRESTEFTYTEFNFNVVDAIEVGHSAMIGDEIVRVESLGVRSFTVKRGCADTVPALHLAGDICWILTDSVGSDLSAYAAGQEIGVKVSPFTTGGGSLPIQQIAPQAVTFNWRYFRPYPPAQMKVNNARWWNGATVTEAQPNLSMTWVHRDRILQADQLIGHDDPSIGPEPGTTYTMHVYNDAAELLRTEVGLRGESFNYQWPQIVNDFGYPDGMRSGTVTFGAHRDALDSMQGYSIPFTVNPAGTLTSQYMAFESRLVEAPYRQNLVNGLTTDSNFALGMSTRPSDRMSDVVDCLGNVTAYTPWATSEFRLPELETTFNVRSTSLYDGVAIPMNVVGKLALIDDEIVEIDAVGAGTYTLRRGCLDTLPAIHLPGARMWFFENGGARDTTPRAGTVTSYFKPKVYGPAIPEAQLPLYSATMTDRSQRPYPPAQMVINGRPWFEEAAANSGGAVMFSWARRNRITQGSSIYDQTLQDVVPEVGQVTRLTFFYTTPATAPGQPDAVHVLRTTDVAGVSYAYTYDLALLDGKAAGTATGVCGSVVISVKIEAVRGGIASREHYTVPLRLPSYPCT